jgi:hypothetical protein
MKVEVASDEKLVGSGCRKRQKGIKLSKKIRRSNIFARLSGGRRRSIDIEDS